MMPPGSNYINTPAWTVGAFFGNYAITPFAIRAIKVSSITLPISHKS
jgi:hypothetical protein